MRLSYRLLFSFMLLFLVALSGFFIGEYVEKEMSLETNNMTFQNPKKIKNEVNTYDLYL